ncbi:hypothetical protein MIND_01274600 [Mycena indigotica]|uniref:NAD(P)-binding protein n=1 Tax=Mycena indigotica TaxID=2126181 RepID=A0A8H6S228_9AGAR|nr:uncharacterized protein MIND_01274600 [Mycena indigotica]KAF7291306.1 hypothetical protein MIND_01274600 [Mycena indigotica]
MPSLSVARSSVAAFQPGYVPVAVFVGGTSGVGQAMAEALVLQLKGRVHIVLIGRNEGAARRILDGFPKPTTGDGWKHEFVRCNVESMKSARAVCHELKGRLAALNFLVVTAGGPRANSLTEAGVTEEGLDDHLATRYFARYLFTKELLPLLKTAEATGQHAHVMTVLGAGFGFGIARDDLMLDQARKASWAFLHGLTIKIAAMKAMMRGVTYNDGLVAHFASANPSIAFTHIMPGQVWTEGAQYVDLGWALYPLAVLLNGLRRTLMVIPQEDCAQYMLHALLSPENDRGGVFIRGDHGDVIGAHVFPPHVHNTWAEGDSRTGYLHGVRIKGYGGADATVVKLIRWTEEVLSGIE